MGLLFRHNAEAKLFERYNVEKIFELRILSVDSDYRGQGLGQTLVKKSEELAKEHGFTVRQIVAPNIESETEKLLFVFQKKVIQFLGQEEFWNVIRVQDEMRQRKIIIHIFHDSATLK